MVGARPAKIPAKTKTSTNSRSSKKSNLKDSIHQRKSTATGRATGRGGGAGIETPRARPGLLNAAEYSKNKSDVQGKHGRAGASAINGGGIGLLKNRAGQPTMTRVRSLITRK